MPSRRSTTTCARTGSPTAATSSTRSRRSSETRPPPRTTMRYAWLPKRDAAKDYGTLPMFEDALAGKLKMLWIVGQNPAVTLPNLKLTFEAMAKLETLVVQEIWETETAAFWKRPGRRPEVHQHRGDPAARGVLHGEERHHQQLGRHGAMAPRRREAAGAGQARRRDRGPRLPQGARSGQGLEGAEGRDHQARPSGPTPRPRTSCARSTATPCATTRRPASRRAISSARSAIFEPTVPRRPAPGSTRASSPTARTSRSAATRQRIREASASIRASGGPGPTTCGSSTTARRATGTASRIRARNRSSGGTSRRSAGRGTTCRTFPSRPTAPTRRTASGPSTSAPRASGASSRPSTRTPTRGIPITGATWPTCRRTARCRRCTSARQALSGLETHRLVGRAGEALDGIRRAGRPRR